MPDPITVQGAIQSALDLKNEQTALRKRITANRRLCLMLVDNDLATEEEAAGIAKLYPPHEKTEKPADSPAQPPAEEKPADPPPSEEKPEEKPAGKAK